MKYTKKILSLLLAVVMVFAMAVTVGADETDTKPGSITIDNAVSGKTYTIYRIFNIDSHNDDYSAFNYKVNSVWNGFFAENAGGLSYVDIDSQGYVTWKASASAADFAAAAIQYAKDYLIEDNGTTEASGSSVSFNNLELGYYLVKSDLGALCSLDTTTPSVTIKEKNGAPTIEKKVQEDSNSNWGKKNDADLGQTVNFQTTINVIDGQPVKYVLHDKMTGLTFGSVSSITVKRNNETVTLTSGTDYTVNTTTLTDGCAFEVVFKDNTVGEVTSSVLQPNDVVTVSYSATVNKDAVIAGTGNPNETWLSYGESGNTQHDVTRTYVWQVNVFKCTKNGDKEMALAGAEFKLYKEVGDQKTKNYVTATEIKSEDNKVTGYKVTGWTETESEGTTFTSPDTGKFDIVGLDADTYYLVETKAPAGYNKVKDAVKIVISKDYSGDTGTATVTYGTNSTGEVKVVNNTGTELPSTGGMGTTIFYILGSVLVLAAVVLLVTKKRMGSENA